MAPARGRKKKSEGGDEGVKVVDETQVTTRSMMTRRSQTKMTTDAAQLNVTIEKPVEPPPARKRTRKETASEAAPLPKEVDEEKDEVDVVQQKQLQEETSKQNGNHQEVKEQVTNKEAKKEEMVEQQDEEKIQMKTSLPLEKHDETTTTTTVTSVLIEENFDIQASSSQNSIPHTTTIKLVDPPPTEVFTEANLIAEAINNHQQQLYHNHKTQSSTILTTPLGHDTSSDSSDSEDAETDDYNDDSGSGSKKSRSNGSHRGAGSSANGVLNKSKIDTDFIAKLIPNKDPNDKRYDLNEINKLRLLSHSYQNFSVKLLTRLFDEEEIIGRNVYGRNYSGDKSATKQPLDPERINFIKETVLRLTKTSNPELAWASCVIAMNRKMVDINNKYNKLKTLVEAQQAKQNNNLSR